MFTYFSGTSLKLNHTSCAAAACCSARGKYTNSEDENAEEASEGDKGVEMYSEAAIGGSGGGGGWSWYWWKIHHTHLVIAFCVFLSIECLVAQTDPL